jgi:hypothetical protein
MSYDLYFYKHKDNNITEEEVAKYLSENIAFNNSEYDRQWSYENLNTGTYFMIDWQEANTDADEIEAFDEFENFVNLNFYFYINFFRPKFFGLETFPIIDKLIRDLDLYVLNPQDHELAESPNKYNNGELLQNWITSNDKVSQGPHKGFNLEYMPLEKSNYFWWYQLHKTELEDSITEDIYIPNLFILKSYEDNLLYTACAWTTHIPLLLPKVDYVIIQKKYKKLFRTIEESGVIKYDTVMEELAKFFADFEFEVPDLKILSQKQADKMEREFNSLVIGKTVKEFGSGVTRDCFVNVPQ